MKVNVSGDYPQSIISKAISRLDAERSSEMIFTMGDFIRDEGFDFNLRNVTDIVTILGTALTVVQLALPIVAKRFRENKLSQEQIENEINKKANDLPHAKDFKIVSRIRVLSPGQVEVDTEVNSKIHLESLEVTSITLINQDQSEVKIKPLKRGLHSRDSKSYDSGIRILFLAANPTDTARLRLDEESRAIDLALQQTDFGDKFEIKHHWAVRVIDIQSYFLRHKPDIVHFSGHGSISSEIILEDISGHSQPVSSRALSRLFAVLKDNIKCVVLNACYSQQQAQAIAEHIDCVIGMSIAVGDKAAIAFATAFYQALGYGRDVKTAFDLGCVQIDMENLREQDTPQLITLRNDPQNIFLVRRE